MKKLLGVFLGVLSAIGGFVDIGDHVKAGQVLAVIEVPEMEQELAEDKAQLDAKQSALETARRQGERVCSSDPATGTGDDGDASIEPEHPAVLSRVRLVQQSSTSHRTNRWSG